MLKKVGIAVLAIIAALIGYGLLGPKSYEVSRSIVINASSENIYAKLKSFEAFKDWSPWSKLDSTMETKITNDGKEGGEYYWKGNKDVGEGRMTFTKLEDRKSVAYDLTFLKPFESKSTAGVNIEAADSGQKVTWWMKGESPFPWNIMGLFMNMDKMIGNDFEKGLANFKTLCENEAVSSSPYSVSEFNWENTDCYFVRKKIPFTDIAKTFGDNIPKLYEQIMKEGGKPGKPMGIFYLFDEQAQMTDMAVAVSYTGIKAHSDNVSSMNIPASKAYKIEYFGDYEKMKPAYEVMDKYVKDVLKAEHPKLVLEEYITDSAVEKDTAKWQTNIVFFMQ